MQTVALFGLISLAPIALLMVTAFVRINIVLILLRQALGSPQVPGNQVLTALALLLTVLVMRPHAERVYDRCDPPLCRRARFRPREAWAAGSKPIKAFMVEQIVLTKHQEYLESLYDYAVPPSPGRVDPGQMEAEDFPLHVVAPAYLLSELTTALLMGFYIYLPFLVIDLVVSSVLAATGLFMLPPSLVATPVKLIVFVLAKGWLLVATMLLSSFAGGRRAVRSGPSIGQREQGGQPMEMTHVIDWSREALRMVFAGRAAAGGRSAGRARDQRGPNLDAVARAGGRADSPSRGGCAGAALDSALVASRWVSFAVDLIRSIPDLL